jgi:hypothetical protein
MTHCNDNPIYIFPEKELRGLSSQFPHLYVCERFIYSQDWSTHIFYCSRIGTPIEGIYKSLTYTWIWKLGMRPHKSFSGNICMFQIVSLQGTRRVRTFSSNSPRGFSLCCPRGFLLSETLSTVQKLPEKSKKQIKTRKVWKGFSPWLSR